MDGEGLVNAKRIKGIKLYKKKKKKESKLKEREIEALREKRAPRNREETERSCATFEGIQSISRVSPRVRNSLKKQAPHTREDKLS